MYERSKLVKLGLSGIYLWVLLILVLKISYDIDQMNFRNGSLNCEIEKQEECFITIHNFVKFNSTAIIEKSPGVNDVHWNTNQNFKTYIYSYTRPFLIELIQNSTQDCLCCV